MIYIMSLEFKDNLARSHRKKFLTTKIDLGIKNIKLSVRTMYIVTIVAMILSILMRSCL